MPNANLVPVRGMVNATIDVTPRLRCQVIDALKSRLRLVEWTDEATGKTNYFLWHRSRRQQASILTKSGDLIRRHDSLNPISKQIAIKWCSRHQAKLPTLSTLIANDLTTSGVSEKPSADPDAISKAIGIFSTNPNLSDRQVAKRAGIPSSSTLTRSEPYQRVKKAFAFDAPPKGTKNGNTGDVDSFD